MKDKELIEAGSLYVQNHKALLANFREKQVPLKYMISGYASSLCNAVMEIYSMKESEAAEFIIKYFQTVYKITASLDSEEEI